jgi:hypothetical protein
MTVMTVMTTWVAMAKSMTLLVLLVLGPGILAPTRRLCRDLMPSIGKLLLLKRC